MLICHMYLCTGFHLCSEFHHVFVYNSWLLVAAVTRLKESAKEKERERERERGQQRVLEWLIVATVRSLAALLFDTRCHRNAVRAAEKCTHTHQHDYNLLLNSSLCCRASVHVHVCGSLFDRTNAANVMPVICYDYPFGRNH